MFQRFTENARRVIFFARYEAGQYGSSHIGSEHLLLGLLREDPALMCQMIPTKVDDSQIRGEIEKNISRGKRISTSVEIPLNEEAKKALNLACEEPQGLERKHVGTGDILLG